LICLGQQIDFVERKHLDGETKLLATRRPMMLKDIAILLRKMR
jgi:ATP-dependent exoDNAse (exonuclease V) beta subunit